MILLFQRCRRCAILCWLFLSLVLLVAVHAKRSSPPEASSTALKVHKLYMLQPPHDMEMYSVLQVSPNATAAQISQSYRRLSRKYHPDKQRRQDQSSSSSSSSSTTAASLKQRQKENLERVQQAYEILKDDATRLLYHKYGMSDPNLAVILLMGPKYKNRPHHHLSKLDAVHNELLQLMGLDADDDDDYDNRSSSSPFCQEHNNNNNNDNIDDIDAASWKRQRRIRLLAARLVELLRPIVEGTIDKHTVGHYLAHDCDRWKTLPMGAQIVRCVGRAYRHAGQDFLNRQLLSTPIRQKWRTTKGFWTALWASGRATVTERRVVAAQKEQQEQQQQKRKEQQQKGDKAIEYKDPLDNIGFLDNDNDDDDPFIDDFSLDLDEEVRLKEQLKAQQTMLQALQVEALWQITKIDLDKAVRMACNMILSGEYFFFPAHQSTNPNEWNQGGHGWVGSSGRVVHADQALKDAAEALVFLGNIMVQRSKEGTAWKE